ncbi:MAG: Nif3-like dinuclear metal center hexameric protein [Chlamydiia bacterium]|nr:Nif3-like dinuclear metal center hexameric protein [Chlamydiia bacterium]
MDLQELCDYLDSYLDCGAFSDYCPIGLQVEGKPNIQRIGTAVSACETAIEMAVEGGYDALIVHHGMFWSGDSYVVRGAKRRKLERLLDSGISLLGYHLPLDAHRDVGNNWKAARDMGWVDLEPFGIYKGNTIGVKGGFSPVAVDVFQAKLEAYYGHPAHCVYGGKREVSTAALISGGAHQQINEAVAAGVDCFITGSFDEPIWHIAKEEGINFFALGHANTETVGPKALGEHLASKFGVDVGFLDVPNPF